MTTVKISPEVELQEAQAHIAHLHNRNLILAQGVAEARALIAEKDARIAELEAQKVDAEPEEKDAA